MPPTKIQLEAKAPAQPTAVIETAKQPALADKQRSLAGTAGLQRAAAGSLPPPGSGATQARMMRAMQGSAGNARIGRMIAATTTAHASGHAVVQRKCACGGEAGDDGMCAECRAKAENQAGAVHRRVQAKMTVSMPGDAQEQEADAVAREAVQRMGGGTLQREPIGIQRSADPVNAPDVTPQMERQINTSLGGGQPLSQELRAPMEQHMAADFSGVRVHADAHADQLSRSLSARAFTTGRDIFFRAGEYNPGTAGGRELLAHELTHTVQQGASAQRQVQRAPPQTGPPEKGTLARRTRSPTAAGHIQRGLLDDISSGVRSVGESVVEGAQSVGQSVVQGVQSVGQSVAEGAQAAWKTVSDGAKSVGETVVSGVKAVAGGAVAAGKSVASGVKSAAGAVGDAAASAANKLAKVQLRARLEKIFANYLPLPQGLYRLRDELKAKKELALHPPEGSTGSAAGKDMMISRQPSSGGNQPPASDPTAERIPAGGCGLCYGLVSGAGSRDAGTVAHEMISGVFKLAYPAGVAGVGLTAGGKTIFPDLAVWIPAKQTVELGEIKPANGAGYAAGALKMIGYEAALRQMLPNVHYQPLTRIIPSPIPFPTLSPNCPQQMLFVVPPAHGVYGYLCKPSFAELMARGCNCGSNKQPKREKKEEKKKEPAKQVDWKMVALVAGAILALGGVAAGIVWLLSPITVIVDKIGAVAEEILAALALTTMLALIAKHEQENKEKESAA